VTTLIDGRENDRLLSDLAERPVFPSTLFLDPEGEVVARILGAAPLSHFVAAGEQAIALLGSRRRVAAGEEGAEVDLALIEGEMGIATHEETVERLEDVELSGEQRRRLRGVRANEVARDMHAVLQGGRGPQAVAAARKEFLALHAEGLAPTDPVLEAVFWGVLGDYASEQGDRKLLEASIARLAALSEGDDRPATARRLARLRERLEELSG
jgi:hypothetical protein